MCRCCRPLCSSDILSFECCFLPMAVALCGECGGSEAEVWQRARCGGVECVWVRRLQQWEQRAITVGGQRGFVGVPLLCSWSPFARGSSFPARCSGFVGSRRGGAPPHCPHTATIRAPHRTRRRSCTAPRCTTAHSTQRRAGFEHSGTGRGQRGAASTQSERERHTACIAALPLHPCKRRRLSCDALPSAIARSER